MKTLLIGTNPYIIFDIWCVEIRKNPDNFEIMMLYIDYSPILKYPGLCQNAILAQRRYDLHSMGRLVGLKKIVNLGADISSIEKVAIQLQLYISLGGISKVWYHHSIPPIMKMYIDSIATKVGIQRAEVTFYEDDFRQKVHELMIGIDFPIIRDYKDLISLER